MRLVLKYDCQAKPRLLQPTYKGIIKFMHPQYAGTIEKLSRWSQQEPSIQGLLVLGSQVRDQYKGDEWSDLDVLLLAVAPHVLMRSNAWLNLLGEVVCVVEEETYLDWINLTWSVKRVLFADHRAVDFSILPAERVDDVLVMNADIHAHGYQIIYDAHPNLLMDKIEAILAHQNSETPKAPSQDELQQVIDQLLFQLIFAGKKIKRNELWVAVCTINQPVSKLLLQLIEYHTTTVVKTSQDIRYNGRFLEGRVAPTLLEKLPGCFARYDRLDAIQTIGRLLEITDFLSRQICEIQGYSFNADPVRKAQKLFEDMFANENI